MSAVSRCLVREGLIPRLRQFLRLDVPPPAPLSSSTATSTSREEHPVPQPSTVTTATPPPPPKPSLDDFADLDLTEAELAELAREISNDDTFSSGLVEDDRARHGYDFSDATRRFEAPTAPLKLTKVNFARALPDRPLASEVVRDELEGIDEGDLDLDELDKLAKELEADELERRRLRDAQAESGGRGVEPPRLPSKDGEIPRATETSSLPKEIAESTTVEGSGGASLSAPLAEIEKLDISTTTLPEPGDLGNKTLTIESPLREEAAPSPRFADTVPLDATDAPAPPLAASATAAKSLFSSVADAFSSSSSSSGPSPSVSAATGEVPARKKSTPTEVDHLKKALAGGVADGTSDAQAVAVAHEKEMPSFGVRDMDPNHRDETEEANEVAEETTPAEEPRIDAQDDDRRDTVDERVAQAVRKGDL